MSRLKIYKPTTDASQIVAERGLAYLGLSPAERYRQMMALIRLSIALNHNKPLKTPQGKGLLLRKNH